MFNRLNVLIETINKQALTIERTAAENKMLRDMFNDKCNYVIQLEKQIDEMNTRHSGMKCQSE